MANIIKQRNSTTVWRGRTTVFSQKNASAGQNRIGTSRQTRTSGFGGAGGARQASESLIGKNAKAFEKKI